MQQITKFKKTEFEGIPEDWTVLPLEDISEKVSVGIATSTTKYFVKEGIPLLRNQNIKEDYIDTTDLMYITEEFSRLNSSRALKEGDVICVRTGYPGQSAVVPLEMNGWHTFTTLIVRPLKNKIDSYYLSRYLNSIVKTKIKSIQAGGSQQNLNAGWLSKIDIKLPPLKEQQKIASILSNVDSLIQKTDQIIEQTRILKKGLMQRLLTKGIGHTKFKKTELGEIPETWQLLTIEDVATIDGGYAFKSLDYVEHGVRLLRITNVSFGLIDLQDKIHLPESYLKTFSRYSLQEGDIVLVLTRPIIEGGIKAAKIEKQHLPLLLNQRVGKFNIKQNKIERDFLYYSIFSTRFIELVMKRVSVTHQPNISPSDIEKFPILLPDILEQRKITQVLSNIDFEHRILMDKKEKLEILKKGLMQQLLTGKIRVKV